MMADNNTRLYKISAILMKYMIKDKIIQDNRNIWERKLHKMIQNRIEI